VTRADTFRRIRPRRFAGAFGAHSCRRTWHFGTCPRLGREGDDLDAAIAANVDFWQFSSTQEAASEALGKIAGAFKKARSAVDSAGTPPSSRSARALLLDRQPYDTNEDWRGRLLAVDVVARATLASPRLWRTPDAQLTFLRLSAEAATPADVGSLSPADKLYGLRLGHFGGFLARSWRANDWMWGRLDAATRLIDLLFEEERILEAGVTKGELEAALAGPLDNPDAIASAADLREWKAVAVTQLHHAILDEELRLAAREFGSPVVPPGQAGLEASFVEYVELHNGAERIDKAFASALASSRAEGVAKDMIRVALRIVQLPALARIFVRLRLGHLARMLLGKLAPDS
jgi:hypothetical protein